MAAAESYPDDLRYHREHDWARIEGDEATLGITWFAVDSLGELVHFEPPEDGATVAKDTAYGEKVVDEPETVNADPYGSGWLVRIRLADAGEVDALLSADDYRQFIAEQ